MSHIDRPTSSTRKFLWSLTGFIVLHLLIRLGMGGTLELDEAEQIILGQQLELGYNTQPPLYTWIQWLFFQLFGAGIFALALLKSLLLFSIYLFTWLIARQVIPSSRMALLASFSLCLIPSIAWESIRDLTHTVLVTAIASATFYTVLRIYQTRSISGYITLGVLLACGMLAKYSFGLFAVSLLLAALSVREYRSLILNRRILLSIGLASLLFLPHLLWSVGHIDEIKSFIGGQVGEGLEASYLSSVLAGFTSLAKNAAEFLILVWLVLTLIFPSAYKPLSAENECIHRTLLARFLIAGGVICVVLILLFGTTQFQSRWFQPLLILFPLYMLSRVDTVGCSVRRETILRSVIVSFMVVVIVLRLGQFWLAPYIKRNPNRMQFPSAELAVQLQQAGFTQGTIIGDSNLTAANLGLYFENTRLLSPKTEFFIAAPGQGNGQCLVVWKATRHDNMPSAQVNYLKKLGIDAQSKPYRYITAPYRYSDSGEHRLGYVLLASDRLCNKSFP